MSVPGYKNMLNIDLKDAFSVSMQPHHLNSPVKDVLTPWHLGHSVKVRKQLERA